MGALSAALGEGTGPDSQCPHDMHLQHGLAGMLQPHLYSLCM